ncbi:uncharacterized protein LOC110922700 [Helianthus annuus]|uniref:uncharacterized protein LOC110922700 n=1 Tax=Helianthus annuus TaxID=4232 RepID=UPI0016530BB4|nr:uncharacterized protein LOC110922700 [Helianthus annuus]KAJ0799575.1 putative reverse transcriptase zinc-binding domain-containing protein [Helianthus annuus]
MALAEVNDKWVWIETNLYEFLICTVKRMLSKRNDYCGNYVLEWCKWLPLKCIVFVWRAEMEKNATGAACIDLNINVEVSNCPFCDYSDETVSHLFCSCMIASTIWLHISRWCKIALFVVSSVRDILELQNLMRLTGLVKNVFHGILIVGCWCLWRARNSLRFENKEVQVEEIIREIKSLGYFELALN